MIGREQRYIKETLFEKVAHLCFGLIGIGPVIRARYLRKALRAIKPFSVKRILDAGCGSGAQAFFLAKLYKEASIDAVDQDEDLIRRCQAIQSKMGVRNISFSVADLTKIDADCRYDLIICFDVLEHISNDDHVLKRFVRTLRPGGKLILHVPRVPQTHFLNDIKRYAKEEVERGKGPHIREGYSEDEILRLLDRRLLVIKRLYTFNRITSFLSDIDFWLWLKGEKMLRMFSYFVLFSLSYLEALPNLGGGNGLLLICEKTSPKVSEG